MKKFLTKSAAIVLLALAGIAVILEGLNIFVLLTGSRVFVHMNVLQEGKAPEVIRFEDGFGPYPATHAVLILIAAALTSTAVMILGRKDVSENG